MSHKILYEGEKVGYFYREQPDNEQGSGCKFLTGGESVEYVNDAGSVSFASLGALLREGDSPLEFLEAPTGSAFAIDPGSRAFVPLED